MQKLYLELIKTLTKESIELIKAWKSSEAYNTNDFQTLGDNLVYLHKIENPSVFERNRHIVDFPLYAIFIGCVSCLLLATTYTTTAWIISLSANL